MVGSSEDTQRALELMLKYLEARYSDQVTTLRDVDRKVELRLGVCAVALGLVTLALPSFAKANIPPWLLVAAIVVLLVFEVCLFRTLWLALRVLSVRVDIPSVPRGVFEAASSVENLGSIQVLRDLVTNYARAVDSNWLLIAERDPAGRAFEFWNKTLVVVAFVSMAFFGMVYLSSSQNRTEASEKMSTDGNAPQSSAPAQAQPAAAPAAPAPAAPTQAQPSLVGNPQSIQLGRSVDAPARTAESTPLKK